MWYGAELLGKVVGGANAVKEAADAKAEVQMSWDEIVTEIRNDYDSNYFVSGLGDMAAYSPDCEYADPFVAFKGTTRFKENVGNLGGLMSDIKLDVYDFVETREEGQILTKWRFSCILDLPWRPLLAAAGSTTHVVDLEAGRVVRHVEAWDIEPSKVVAQLFRPASKMPTSRAETFMMSLSEGDVQGMWYVISPTVLKASVALSAAGLIGRSVVGSDGPSTVEEVAYALVLSCCITELVKFAKQMTGGESG